MIRYYQRLPSAAVYREIDGNMYANVNACIRRTTTPRFEVTEVGTWRTVRFDSSSSFMKRGEAYVYIGSLGEAIAPTSVPFGVLALAENEELA